MDGLMTGFEAKVYAAAPYVKKNITAQQELILAYMLGGLAMGHAITAAGVKGTTVQKLLENENFMAYVNYFGEQKIHEIQFGVDDAHRMLLEAHRKAISSTEEVVAIKEMIALHGLAAPKRQINQNYTEHVIREGDYKVIPEEKLMQLAQGALIDLEPTAIEYDSPKD